MFIILLRHFWRKRRPCAFSWLSWTRSPICLVMKGGGRGRVFSFTILHGRTSADCAVFLINDTFTRNSKICTHMEGKLFFITQHLSECWLKYILNMKLKSDTSLKHFLLRIRSFVEYAQETTGLLKKEHDYLDSDQLDSERGSIICSLQMLVSSSIPTSFIPGRIWWDNTWAKHLVQNVKIDRCPENVNYSSSFPPHAELFPMPPFVCTVPTSLFSTSWVPAQSSRLSWNILTLTRVFSDQPEDSLFAPLL